MVNRPSQRALSFADLFALAPPSRHSGVASSGQLGEPRQLIGAARSSRPRNRSGRPMSATLWTATPAPGDVGRESRDARRALHGRVAGDGFDHRGVQPCVAVPDSGAGWRPPFDADRPGAMAGCGHFPMASFGQLPTIPAHMLNVTEVGVAAHRLDAYRLP